MLDYNKIILSANSPLASKIEEKKRKGFSFMKENKSKVGKTKKESNKENTSFSDYQ